MSILDVNVIAKELDKLCAERGISRYALSKISGVPESTIRNIFTKGTIPTLYNLEKLCEGLGITMPQFFYQSDFYANFTEEQKELLEIFMKVDEQSRQRILLFAKMVLELKQKNE